MNYWRIKVYNLIFLLLLNTTYAFAQRVGVVLSGGAASGIAHIGVLKALEENNIPIDYITGTSMGALIGSLYAMGYSPNQIEQFAKSEEFRNMAEGIIDQKYAYYFKRNDYDASWITIRLADSALITAIPTNLISPIAMDFGMMELSSAAIAKANYNFDSLFIPFRCVASDIEHKASVIFKSGDLAEAVRASMSYPFYIKPIVVNNRLLFDGGLYNNFPSDIMYNDFFPDIIIGSNVTSNNPPPDEDNVLSQIKSMLQNQSNYSIPCENGVIIEPKTDVGLFNFNNVVPLIDSGYAATMRKINELKLKINRTTSMDSLTELRSAYKKTLPTISIDRIKIEGLNSNQKNYARKILSHNSESLNLKTIKEGYFRLSSDSKIKYIFPKTKFNSSTGFFDLSLRIKKERSFITEFGGNFSNRPISMGFISFKYNYLGKFGSTLNANVYFGKLYSSVSVRARLDFPFKTPIYIEPIIVWNRWDYYKSSNAFLEDVRPAYLLQNEEYGAVNFGFPTGKKGRIVAGGGYGRVTDRYYQTSSFTQKDTADRTDFDVGTAQAYYEINSLNRKQYANQGEYLNIKVRYVNGFETTTNGSTSKDSTKEFYRHHEWLTIKMKAEKYFNRTGMLKIGLFGEGAYSTQTLFRNYTASILASPAFQPTPDSKSIFLEKHRAHKYLAGGVKIIVALRKNIEFRGEAYIFQPFQALIRTEDNRTEYSKPFALQHYIGTAALVWNSPVGPMSLSLNYYDNEKDPFAILFHFGYIIYNKRLLE
jgi:NTE family protein